MASDGHRHAVVTLVTSDSYLAGALVALNSLLDAESASASPTARAFATVCLATPASLAHSTVQALERAFDVVIGVEPILTRSWEELALLGEFAPRRPLWTPLGPQDAETPACGVPSQVDRALCDWTDTGNHLGAIPQQLLGTAWRTMAPNSVLC